MNSKESFDKFVVVELNLRWIDYDYIKTLHINNHVDDWVKSGYVKITQWDECSHHIKLTETGKSIVLMERL